MSRDNLLIFADSERDANMLYAVRMFVREPFAYLRINGRGHMVLRDMETNQVRQDARGFRVVSLDRSLRSLRADGIKNPSVAHVIRGLLKARRLTKVCVPDNFPLALASDLRRLKVHLRLRRAPFFPERALKSAEELKKISAALMMAEVGLAEGIQAVKNAKVGKSRRLIYHNLPLTSEKLRSIIDTAIMQVGGMAVHTVVAGGRQACDPHRAGQGVLRANEPIVIEVCPRSQRTGYYGDISRTVVKGCGSEPVRKLYHTVMRAQDLACAQLSEGVPAKGVHRRVQEFFHQEGYPTGKRNGLMQGFPHGTGHGLGLDPNEAPHLCALSPDVLQAGHVVTIHPGLYYPELGGVRLEDVLCVTAKGSRNLTQFEKILEV